MCQNHSASVGILFKFRERKIKRAKARYKYIMIFLHNVIDF